MIRNITFIVLILVLPACGRTFSSEYPMTTVFNKIHGVSLPEGMSADAKAGWDDGCKSGYTTYGDHMYKAIYGFKRNTDMVGNGAYEANWYDGYHYCRQSINTYIGQGLFGE